MARVTAVANQKGGVAKTTTVHTLGAALAERGRRVLLVDLDPQACLTYSTGTDPESLEVSLHDVFLSRQQLHDTIVKVEDTLHLAPSTIDLAGSEVHLLARTGREYALRRALSEVVDGYDVVLIDCPPSLGILTINGLTAADDVLIPLQCETLGRRGVRQLLETIEDIRSFTNPRLEIRGVVATLYDPRTNLARSVVEDVRRDFGLEVLDPPVPKSVRFAEAPSRGTTILRHAPRSKGADAYRRLCAQLWGE